MIVAYSHGTQALIKYRKIYKLKLEYMQGVRAERQREEDPILAALSTGLAADAPPIDAERGTRPTGWRRSALQDGTAKLVHEHDRRTQQREGWKLGTIFTELE